MARDMQPVAGLAFRLASFPDGSRDDRRLYQHITDPTCRSFSIFNEVQPLIHDYRMFTYYVGDKSALGCRS